MKHSLCCALILFILLNTLSLYPLLSHGEGEPQLWKDDLESEMTPKDLKIHIRQASQEQDRLFEELRQMTRHVESEGDLDPIIDSSPSQVMRQPTQLDLSQDDSSLDTEDPENHHTVETKLKGSSHRDDVFNKGSLQRGEMGPSK